MPAFMVAMQLRPPQTTLRGKNMVDTRRHFCRSASGSLLQWIVLVGCVSGCGVQTSQSSPANKVPPQKASDAVASDAKIPETDTAMSTQNPVVNELSPGDLVQRTLSQRHELNLNDVDLKSALKLIGDYHQLNFDLSALSAEQLGQRLSVEVSGEPLNETLERMLSTHGLRFDILPNGVVSVASL